MANMRKCPKCAKVENSFTFFCTECGTKTVEYTDNGNNQQFSNANVEKPIEKNNISTDKQNKLHVENVIDSELSNDEHQDWNNQVLQTQNLQTSNEASESSNAPVSNGNANLPPSFRWSKKYTYICVAIGACLILGLIILQVNKSNKSQSSELKYANENHNTNEYGTSDDWSEDSNLDISNQYESNSDEEGNNQESNYYDGEVDVEGIVSDIREKYNSIVEDINENSYYCLTYPSGVSAYYDGDSLRAIRVQRYVDNSPYAKYYYYDNGLFFAYYESTDAHRLYFDKEQLIRWRYSADSTNPQEATNNDLVRDADYNQVESDVLSDSAYYIQYISNTEGFDVTEYVLPGSDSRYIDKRELENFTPEECRLARNEIYARHGRMFTDEGLQSFFDSKDWYTVRRRITIGCNSKLNFRLTPIRPRGLACNCTFLSA